MLAPPPLNEPGTGPGWTRLATAAAEALPVAELVGLWVFPPLRREGREWGTAILARGEGDRRRIYTAKYMLQLKGKERGTFAAEVEEVGSGPVEALDELVASVPKRSDEEPPLAIPLETWFPEEADDGAAREG